MKIRRLIRYRWLLHQSKQEYKRTGKSRMHRRFQRYTNSKINPRADTPHEFFHGFEYLIEVDPGKFLCYDIGPHAVDSSLVFPNRSYLGSVYWAWMRLYHGQVNEIAGSDYLFVATNSYSDAIEIALKYS